MSKGIKLGKIYGLEIFLDYTWIIVFVIITWVLAQIYFPSEFKGFSIITYILLGLITSILFFTSTLIHEIAHSLVALKNNIKVRRITLFLFGGISELFEEPSDAETEFKVAISGPATSIVLSLIFLALWNLSLRYFYNVPFIAVTSTLFEINLILTFFNLLPGFPLDGGRIVRSIAWAITKDLKGSTRLATTLGQMISLFIIFFGILQIIIVGMWSGVWLILIGLFLIQAANQSYLELRIKEILEDLHVEDLMNTNILTLSPNLSINDALAEYFIRYASQSFPVVDKDEVVGLISLKDIREKIVYLDDDARVHQAMRIFPSGLSQKPQNKALDALRMMIEKDLSFLPVKQDSKIIGMITLEAIANYLADQNII